MTSYIRPCPECISAAVMQLIDEWKSGEIEPEEYNRRFEELQSEANRVELEENQTQVL